MMWIVFGLLTAFFYSLSPLLTRYLVKDKEFHALSLEPVITTISLFINLCVVLLMSGFIQVPFEIIVYGVISGVLVYIAGVSWQLACHYEEASFVSPLLQLDAFVAALLGIFILGESITLLNGLGVLIIFVGGYAIASNGIRMVKPSKGLALVLLSVLLAAIFKFLGALGTVIDPLVFGLIVITTRSIVGWLVFAFREGRTGFKSIEKIVLTKKGALGVLARSITSFGAHICMFIALSMGLLSKVVPVANAAPLFAVLLGGRLLKEKNMGLRLAASLVIIAGVFLVAF